MRLLWACTLATLGVFVAHTALGLGSGSQGLFNALYVGLYCLTGAICVARGALIGSERSVWIGIGLGMAAWGGGYLYFFVALQDLAAPPYPSPSDALWLIYYVLVAIGLMKLVRSRTGNRDRGLWIDATVGALALAALAAALLVHPILDATGASASAVATSVAYPLADVLILGLLVVAISATGWRPGRALTVLAAAFVVQACFDTVYLYQVSTGSYQGGTLLDASWPAIMLLVGYSAWQRPAPVAPRESEGGFAAVAVPVTFAALALGIITYDHWRPVPDVAQILATSTLLAAFALTVIRFSRKRTLERSRELVAEHSLILNSAGEGIYGLDGAGRVTFVNEAAARILGYAPEVLVGEHAHALFHHARPDGTPYPSAECPVQRSLTDGEAQRATNEVYWRKDGSSFPVEYTTTPIAEGDEVTGAVIVFRDITERQAVDRMKDEFTAIVSHELRTPLTSIRGSLGLLASGAMGDLPVNGQRMLDIAVQNTDRLVRLINDILDIERMDSGGVEMQMEPCDACDLIRQAVELMDPLARDAGVRLEHSSTPARLHGDADRLIQTLTNLVSNAIKFSDAGSVVKVESDFRDGRVVFRVADAGRGIPADKLETIFDRFEQVDASDSRERGGTGLGLAICRTIVTKHDGRIWADSSPGLGSTFSVEIPGELAEARPVAPAHGGDGPTVLVCDHDADVLEVVDALLVGRGYRVITARTGEEAIERAREAQPDAILLDLLMPGMDGWETAAALRCQAGTAATPILMMSVVAESEAHRPAEGAASWLSKPIDEGSLFEALDSAVGRDSKTSGVLIVEDDEDLSQVLLAMFERHGLETTHAPTAQAAIEMTRDAAPDLLVLDVALPDGDGFQIVEALRARGTLAHMSTVVYSATDLPECDRSQLRLGARTDFLTKGRVSPEDFERHVLSLIHEMTSPNGQEATRAEAHSDHR